MVILHKKRSPNEKQQQEDATFIRKCKSDPYQLIFLQFFTRHWIFYVLQGFLDGNMWLGMYKSELFFVELQLNRNWDRKEQKTESVHKKYP